MKTQYNYNSRYLTYYKTESTKMQCLDKLFWVSIKFISKTSQRQNLVLS